MRVCNLASGSKGNCTYVETETARLLIDAGTNMKYIVESLKSIEILPESIDAIIITHEHSDHISALANFCKRYKTKVFCNIIIQQEIEKLVGRECIQPYTKDFYINKAHIYPIDIPHDSLHCNAYRIEADGTVASFITDLGYLSKDVLSLIKGSALVYLESNYDEEMLFTCSYPYVLKQRIKGKFGHLSNMDCASASEELSKSGTRLILLAHLSENSNNPRLAFNTVCSYLASRGIIEGEHIRIDLTYQRQRSSIYKIKT